MNGAGSVWVREKQRAYLQGVFQKTHKNKLEVHVERQCVSGDANVIALENT